MSKSQRFGLVLSPVEKRILVKLAETDGGLSQAATLRRLIRQEALHRGLWPPSSGKQDGAQISQEKEDIG